MRRTFLIPLLFVIAAVLVCGPVVPARAQAASPGDLIAEVNALRSEYGLPPYQVDSGLMASAQAQSDYQASIAQLTHNRADGSTPANYTFIENIAGGYNLSPHAAVYTFWQDSLHLATLVGFSSGVAGAGMTVADGFVYYTFQMRRAADGQVITLPAAAAVAAQPVQQQSTPTTANLISPVDMVTPQPDGSIVHEVLPGQSPWSIATTYNITIADLVALNGLAPTPVIFPGQKLLIRQAQSPTPAPTGTNTQRPPTRTPTPTRTERPPTQTPTITFTPTPTTFSLVDALPELNPGSRRVVGIVLIVVCGLGLLALIFSMLRKGS